MNEAQAIDRLANTSLLNTNPIIIGDTTTYSDVNGYAVYCLEEATFDTSTIFLGYKGTNPNTLTMPTGHTWYIKVRDIKLASGKVFVYTAKL